MHHLPNGILTLHALLPSSYLWELCIFQQCLCSQLLLHCSSSGQGLSISLCTDHSVQQVHDPGRTICTSIIENNVKSAAFLKNYGPPATSGSRSVKGRTLLMQLWFWLFVQESNCTVVAAGLSSSVVRTRYIDVSVLYPARKIK